MDELKPWDYDREYDEIRVQYDKMFDMVVALRAEVAKEKAACDEFMNINEGLNERITLLLERVCNDRETIAAQDKEIAALNEELERWKAPLTEDQVSSICAIIDVDESRAVASQARAADTVFRAVREAGEKT